MSASAPDLGLEQAVDRLGKRVVVAVANAANRGLDACLGEAFGVFDRQIRAAAVAVVNPSHTLDRAPLMDSLFQGIEDRAMGTPLVRETMARPGMRGGADAPTDDLAGIRINE